MGMACSKKLSQDDLTFLKRNTNFDEKQIKAWYKGFMRDCPSGQLSKDKFLEVYTSFFPRGDADKFCGHVFRTFDEDKSGRIDFREFMLAIYVTSAGKAEQKLAWAFQMYDVNGDGFIQTHEMIEIITAIYNMVGPTLSDNVRLVSPEGRTEEIFTKMDLNNDGLLSKEEFLKGCMDDKFLFQMLTSEFEVL